MSKCLRMLIKGDIREKLRVIYILKQFSIKVGEFFWFLFFQLYQDFFQGYDIQGFRIESECRGVFKFQRFGFCYFNDVQLYYKNRVYFVLRLI